MVERPSRFGAVIVAVVLLGVYVLSMLWSPPDGDYFTICGFKSFTGLPCPACGLTHSFCAVGKGDLSRAFAYNLLGPPLLLFSLLVWIRSFCVVVGLTRRAATLDHFITRLRPVHAFLIGFLVFGIGRIAYLLAIGHGGQSRLTRFLEWLGK